MDVFEMSFSKVFPLLVAKAQRKGRTADEVYAVTRWLTGYSKEDMKALETDGSTYGAFQAAKNRAISMSVMMVMNPAPASTKSVKIFCW